MRLVWKFLKRYISGLPKVSGYLKLKGRLVQRKKKPLIEIYIHICIKRKRKQTWEYCDHYRLFCWSKTCSIVCSVIYNFRHRSVVVLRSILSTRYFAFVRCSLSTCPCINAARGERGGEEERGKEKNKKKRERELSTRSFNLGLRIIQRGAAARAGAVCKSSMCCVHMQRAYANVHARIHSAEHTFADLKYQKREKREKKNKERFELRAFLTLYLVGNGHEESAINVTLNKYK